MHPPSPAPTGFAYGHLGSKAVAVSGQMGRGMAAQQILEELSSRKALSYKVGAGAGVRWMHRDTREQWMRARVGAKGGRGLRAH
jgi:hypothetical protein